MKRLLPLMVALAAFNCFGATTIKLFTDYPNTTTPVSSDFLLFQRGGTYVNSSQSQYLPTWFNSPVFTGNGSIAGSFNIGGNETISGSLTVGGAVITGVTYYGDGSGLSNVAQNVYLKRSNDNGTNESFWGVTFFQEVDALNFYPTNLFTGLTNAQYTATDGNGKLIAGTGLPATNVLLSAGANIVFSTNGAGQITIASSGTNVVQTVTNNTFVNTNIFIATSNAFINNSYVTNEYVINETNNTFVNTNVLIVTSNEYVNISTVTNANITNLFFISGKGNTLIITNNFSVGGSQTNLLITANSAVITKGDQVLTNAVNAVGVFTNSASGPPSFGLLANNLLQNSSITIAGTANQVSVSGGGPVALGGTATLSLPNPVIAPGPVSGTQLTNTSFAASGVVTNDANGKTYTTPTIQNALLANSSITIQGSAVALGGSTLAAGSSPFFNAANITNVQGGTIVGGTKTWQFDASYLWPGDTLAATWTTNTPGAGSSSIQSAGPSIKAWQISTSATNQVLLQVPMPADWDGGTVNVWINLVSGTNSAVANAITNTWGCSAARVGTALGTAILITNNLPGGTALIETNFNFNTLTIAGSPKPGDYCLFQIQGRGGVAPFSSTNTLLLTSVGLQYNVTNIQNNAITWP